jgi:hypothetical protein
MVYATSLHSKRSFKEEKLSTLHVKYGFYGRNIVLTVQTFCTRLLVICSLFRRGSNGSKTDKISN